MDGKRSFLRWQNFKRKAVTLSYDDGPKFDETLIEILNRYGLKCTFNLNSGYIPDKEGEWRMSKAKIQALIANSAHEIAVHGVRHLSLSRVNEAMAIEDIINDRKNLENAFERIVKGLAYANGSFDDEVVELLKKCGISYARTVVPTNGFDLPKDFLEWNPTCHHGVANLMALAKEFVETEDHPWNFWANNPMLFYLWGHSYEFDGGNNWKIIEEFAKFMGGREDIWYATNGEIYEYVRAYDRLDFSADGGYIHNPSAIDIYLCYFKKNYVIPAGKTVKVDASY